VDRPALLALVFGLAGVAYRLVLALLTVPGSNSDEAAFGLAALHIAGSREHPVFLYGQHYMGTVESYLAAPLVLVFGHSWPALRIPLLFLYATFVYLMYRLTRRLFSPWLATWTVALLALGSERVVRDQMTAVGGRPEIKPALVLMLLIAVGLGQHRVRHRWTAYAGFGILAGLILWDDWLALPYLAAAVGVLLVASGRQLLGRAGVLVLGGVLLGALPLILDNLTAPAGLDSFSVFRQLSRGEGPPAPLADRVSSALWIGLPMASGLCRPDGCAPWQAWWGVLYLALLATTAVLAVASLRRAATGPGARTIDASGTEQPVRGVAQLALVFGAAMTLVAYTRNSLAGTAPIATARYLSILQISLPAVLWPLWLAARRARGAATRTPARIVGAAAAAVLVALTASMILSTAVLISQIRTIRAEERNSVDLATATRRAGITHVYGEYWTCNRLIFNSGERVICAVIGPDLRPGQNRYPPYASQVDAARRPAYVLAAGQATDTAFAAYLRARGLTAQVSTVGGYRIYRPDTTVRPRR
jgi:hypothetical protein